MLLLWLEHVPPALLRSHLSKAQAALLGASHKLDVGAEECKYPCPMCTLPRYMPSLQTGSWGHRCPTAQEMGYNVCTCSTTCQNVCTDGLRIGGARKQHAYVCAVIFGFACLCMCVCIHACKQGWCSRSWPGRSGSAGPCICCMAALCRRSLLPACMLSSDVGQL